MQGNSYSKQTLQTKKINYVVNTLKDSSFNTKQDKDGNTYLILKFDMGYDEVIINLNTKLLDHKSLVISALSLSEKLRKINELDIEELRKKTIKKKDD